MKGAIAWLCIITVHAIYMYIYSCHTWSQHINISMCVQTSSWKLHTYMHAGINLHCIMLVGSKYMYVHTVVQQVPGAQPAYPRCADGHMCGRYGHTARRYSPLSLSVEVTVFDINYILHVRTCTCTCICMYHSCNGTCTIVESCVEQFEPVHCHQCQSANVLV